MRRIRSRVLTLLLLSAGATAPVRAAAPPLYSLPWNLRPAAPARVLRLDTVVARYEDASGNSGSTVASLLLGSIKVAPRLALHGRVGVVVQSPPAGESPEVAFTNVAVGGSFAPALTSPDWRLNLYLLAALPVGSGGGNEPDADQRAAIQAGIAARSAMDNAMFAVNDFVVFPGVDLAWVRGGWTVQGEATLLQLMRVRGENSQPDGSRTNFTAGLHVGRFLGRSVSLGSELRYQRWLSTPEAVEAAPKARDTATVAIGPRFHIRAGENSWFRPGISLALPLDDPMSAADYRILQIDLPCSF